METLVVNKSSKLYYDYPMHKHGYWELLVNLYGSGTLVAERESFPFTEGTISLIPPNVPHSKTAPDGFMDGCIFVKDLAPIFGDRVICFEDDSKRTFQSLFMMAFDIQLRNEANSRGIINALTDTLYQILLSWNTHTKRRSVPVENFQSELRNNISNCEFDVSAAIDKTGYCKSYFRKLFREVTGASPINYFNHMRIEHSKTQLRQYHQVRTIKEIALSAGFSDPYYFSRTFKQHEGISPKQYIDSLGSFDLERLAEEGDVERNREQMQQMRMERIVNSRN